MSQGAAALGISQPSASARIRRLESVLGVRLFDRSPGGVVVTEAGAVAISWAERVLDAVEQLMAGTDALRRGKTRPFRIAASLTIAEHLLPSWLASFASDHPDVDVELEVVNSRGVTERLRNRTASLGFVEGPQPPRGLHCRQVARDELLVVVGRSHRWAKQDTVLCPADVAQEQLVLRERGSGTREMFEQALAAVGMQPAAPFLELASTSAIKATIAGGRAAAVLSDLAVDAELRTGALHRVPVTGLDLRRALRAVWSGRMPPASPAALLLRLFHPVRHHGR